MKIVTSEQMRSIDGRCPDAGVPTDTLMENAGLAVAKRVRHHLGGVMGVPVVVLVGPGNNGGDGLVVARHLHSWGARAIVYLCAGRPADDPKLAMVQDQGTPVLQASTDDGFVRLRQHLEAAKAVVDSVIGTGRLRPMHGTLREVFLALADTRSGRSDLRLIALDLPSGLDADTGAVDPVCPIADVTVTLGYPKQGLFLFPGAEHAGALETVDIGIPPGLDDDVTLELMTRDWAGPALPPRSASAHKGTFGSALVVAGCRNYVGAAYLAAMAAARSGAGLVTLAIPESIQSAVAARAVEPTYLPLPESSPGVVSPEAATIILDNLGGYDSLLVGCGIGQAPATREMVERLLYSGADLPPTVVDADGLNLLALSQNPGWWERFPSQAIVTPHPGEMSRLSGITTQEVQIDRTGGAVAMAVRWNKVTVLKGAYTVVAFPDGRAMVSPIANPGLASAGTGDVLAGAIAGLLAQGATLERAAALGVFLHGLAGDEVRGKIGDTGMLASDVLAALPGAIRDLRRES